MLYNNQASSAKAARKVRGEVLKLAEEAPLLRV